MTEDYYDSESEEYDGEWSSSNINAQNISKYEIVSRMSGSGVDGPMDHISNSMMDDQSNLNFGCSINPAKRHISGSSKASHLSRSRRVKGQGPSISPTS